MIWELPPANLLDFDLNDPGKDQFIHEERIFPEVRELRNYWIYSDINDSETIKISLIEAYSIPPKKSHASTKTDVYHFDDF